MKTIKIIISLLTVLLFCATLTACAKENKEQPKQDSAQVEAEQKEKDQDVRDQNAHIREPVEPKDDGGLASREQKAREQSDSSDEDDRIDTPEKDDGGLAEREQEAREQQEQAEQERERREQEEREEQERREQEEQQQQQISSYEHHIGEAVFYTEHDLRRYIIPDPDNPGSLLDLETMLHDVWGDVGLLEVSNGYFGADGGSTTRGVAFETISGDLVPGVGYTVKDSYIYVGKNGEKQYDSVVRIYNEKQPPGNWIVVKNFTFGFSPDAAALLLYMLEQNELNPRGNIAGELPLPDNYECGYH